MAVQGTNREVNDSAGCNIGQIFLRRRIRSELKRSYIVELAIAVDTLKLVYRPLSGSSVSGSISKRDLKLFIKQPCTLSATAGWAFMTPGHLGILER